MAIKEIDFGVFAIYVEDEQASLDEVSADVDETIESIQPIIRDLKEMDYEIAEDFAPEEESRLGGFN